VQIEGTETLADAQLVALAKCGERSAFGELARRHYRRFVAVALSLLRNREDAEDEVQTALRKGLEHIGDLQTNEHFGTWQARIVINECYMRMRDRKHYHTVDRDEALPEDHLLLYKTAGPTAEATLLYDEALQIVRLEVQRVPPFLRIALILSDIDHKPMSEIAAQLGISVGAAKSRLHRARRELRDRLKRRGIECMPRLAA